MIDKLRYGAEILDLRRLMIKFCAWLQGKPLILLDRDPLLCAKILEASEIKGTFLEQLLAQPAWQPVYSTESEDGARWQELTKNVTQILRQLPHKSSLTTLTQEQTKSLTEQILLDPERVLNAQDISRLSVTLFCELLFQIKLEPENQTLFYQASLEWRKEIAVKGKGDRQIKAAFMSRLTELIAHSGFAADLESHPQNPALLISAFAQPFILSPQINFSDIIAAVFFYLRRDPALFAIVVQKAEIKDMVYLNAVIMEALRLQHPFPILERELPKAMEIKGRHYRAGSQVMILLDQFKQDQVFNPERWLNQDQPFAKLAFGSGRRICPGKNIATTLLQEILAMILTQLPQEKIRPEIGHLYSGRDNDKNLSLAETFYQLRIFWGVIKNSWRIGKEANHV